jgi:hypothetical protein
LPQQPQTINFKYKTMPGFELWSDKERKEVNDVLETGILMRYGFDGPRKVFGSRKSWKPPSIKPSEANTPSFVPVVLPH